jgi:hypothetical protein
MTIKEDAKVDEDNEADDEGNGPLVIDSKAEDKIEEQDKVPELLDPETGNVIHKKRRRKNVESRDVYT